MILKQILTMSFLVILLLLTGCSHLCLNSEYKNDCKDFCFENNMVFQRCDNDKNVIICSCSTTELKTKE